MPTKLYSGKSVIVKVVTANAIVALCIMVFLGYNNFYIKEKIKEKSYSNSLDQLGVIKTFFFTELNRVKGISVAMSNSNKVSVLDKAAYNSPAYFANLETIKNNIELVRVSVPYNIGFHVLLKNYNMMVSDSGSYSAEIFPTVLHRKYEGFPEDNNTIQSLPEGIHSFDDFILYINRSNPNIQIYADLQKESFGEYLLQRSKLPDTYHIIYLGAKPLIQSPNLPMPVLSIKDNLDRDKDSIRCSNGDQYSLIAAKDTFSQLDLSFVSVYPTSSINKSVEFANNYTNLVVIIFMLINVMLIFFQYKVYNPIKRLASQLGEQGRKEMGDEIDIINTALENLKEDNAYMQGIIEQTKDVYKIQVLLDLMYDENEEVDTEILAELNKEFEHFVTMISLFDLPKEHVNTFEARLEERYDYVKVVTDSGNRVYVVPCDNHLQLSMDIKAVLASNCMENKAVFGISEVFEDVRNLCTAYMQCVQSLYNCKVGDLKRNPVSIYIEDIVRISYVIPSEDDKRLVNLVMSGNVQEVEAFFDDFLMNKAEEISYKSFKRIYLHLISLLGNIIYIKEIKEDALGGETQDVYHMASVSEIHHYVKVRFMNISKLCKDMTGDLYERIVKYVNKNINTDLSVNSIAYKFDITPEYLSTYFKKHAGANLSLYINNLRMEFAIGLLNEKRNIKISDIAVKVGIDNVNTFIRKFKAYTGTTPAKFKETIDTAE